ncbi:MAG: hypothetical protein MMC23_008938 [Stictis urceolatum]|nr:hypothetical protein [Stictis urceolata]
MIAAFRQHLENVKPVVSAGKVIAGGATLAEPLKEGEKPKMTGSVMIALADSEAEVREILQKDIYVESGVWNWDAVTITPIKIVVRKTQPDLGF